MLIGQSVVVATFTAAVLALVAYGLAANGRREWLPAARWGFLGATLGAVTSGLLLMWAVVQHRFDISYVYSYSDRSLDFTHGIKSGLLLISTFYAGQEGSFMLWCFYTALLGLGLSRYLRDGSYEAPVMAVVTLAVVCLQMLILGIDVPGIGRIGASPFAAVWDVREGMTPGVVPADGVGLNPLLQNPWMVIHPPTLFMGFASLIVPFAFAVAALWQGTATAYREWVRVALPWALFTSAVLGCGIILGGYWAYKVLGWGGYWGWDPVENMSFVPWLGSVALLHTMVAGRRTDRMLRTNFILAIGSYLMILYSTFLTRSGVLADFSVHSFTSLGLTAYLLIFIGIFAALGGGLLIARWRSIPRPPKAPVSASSREFFMYTGALTLCFAALVIALGTSAPLITRLWVEKPSAVDPSFYNQTTLPLAILVTALVGAGQLLWWKASRRQQVVKLLFWPVGLALAATALTLAVGPTSALGSQPLIMLFLLTSFFALFANGQVAGRLLRGNPKYAGGALTHIGLAVLFLGVIASSVFDRKETITLVKGKPTKALSGDYTMTFVQPIPVSGDSSRFLVQIARTGRDESFQVAPLMFFAPKSASLMANPDVRHFADRDVYLSAMGYSPAVDPSQIPMLLAKGDSTQLGPYLVRFDRFDVQRMAGFEGQPATAGAADDPDLLRVAAELTVLTRDGIERLAPVYSIKPGGATESRPALTRSGVAIRIQQINADNGQVSLIADLRPVLERMPPMARAQFVDQPESLTVEASVKPWIALVWLGTVVLLIGFAVSIVRRYGEHRDAVVVAAPVPLAAPVSTPVTAELV